MPTLVTFPNQVLKQQAEPFQFETEQDLENARQLEIDMVKLMIESNGIGLAANQVGILKRVFAIRLQDQVPFCMFNPIIVSHTDDIVEAEEGCLSFPNLWLKVKRPSSITAEYFDRQGKKCIIELKGIDARCFQHELDHLDGVCFTDKISPLKLALAKKKLQKRKKFNG
jgi:peptide deformylase